MDYWSIVEELKGQTLHTLDQLKPFDIQSVDRTGVLIFIHYSNNERWIQHYEIDGAWKELVRKGSIARSGIRDRYSIVKPAYVAAILASLPNVENEVRPIRLYYVKRE